MNNRSALCVRRVRVSDPVAVNRRYDRADAFGACLPRPDPFWPETWIRAGIEPCCRSYHTPRRVVVFLSGAEGPRQE